MKLFRLFISLGLVLVGCLAAGAANTVALSAPSGTAGQEVSVSVSLANTEAISALQVLVDLPEGADIVPVEGSAKTAGRASGHKAQIGLRNGSLSLMLYSADLAEIEAGSGIVATFSLRFGSTPIDISVTPRVIASDRSGKAIATSAMAFSIASLTPKAVVSASQVDFGRIPIRATYTQGISVRNPGTAPLVISGLQFSAPEFSLANQLPVTVAAGSSTTLTINYAPTERGAVAENMKLQCNTPEAPNAVVLLATPYAVNELHVADAQGICDNEVTIPLSMNNMDAVTGFTIEFKLPSELEYVDDSFELSSRKADHAVAVNCKDGLLSATAYSLTDSPFSGDDGEIASFKVVLRGRYGVTLEPSKAVFSAMYKGKVTDVLSDTYSGYVSIQAPSISVRSTFSVGRTPVTEDYSGSISVRNSGSAPLSIDRVVNDVENLSVATRFPLTIKPYSSGNIELKISGSYSGQIEGRLQLSCNDPQNRMKAITIAGERYTPNSISLRQSSVAPTDRLVMVDLALDNYDRVAGLQFDVEYDPEWFTPADGVETVLRSEGYSAMKSKVDDKTVRYFCYNLGGTAIEAGGGTVFHLPFDVAAGAPRQEHQFKIKNVIIGTPDLEDKNSELADQAFSINPYQRRIGDINGDLRGVITIGDIQQLETMVGSGKKYEAVKAEDAELSEVSDVAKDQILDVTDVTRLIDIKISEEK